MINLKNKKTIYIILIFFIIIISIFPYFYLSNEKKLCITINGIDVTDEYLNNNKYIDTHLSDDNKKVINIQSEFGNNKIAIYNHQVECIYSDCSNQICVNTGLIDDKYDNKLIICAPHRLVVYYK